MTSLTDFDQGGSFRTFTPIYMGPSVGWVSLPRSILPITSAGTFQLQEGVILVTVSVAGAVTVKLPSAINPTVPAGVQGGLYVNAPITIVDIGGNASAHPITIQAFSVSENIMSFQTIQITINFGGFTLQAIPASSGWNSISP